MDTATRPVFAVQRSQERAYADHGWLKTFHSFAFADYFDPDNTNWGALRVFNDDTILGGGAFPTHPHRDMEILTYVLDGSLVHQDSMGNRGVVTRGGVQYLSAGTGIRHSEANDSATVPLRLVQMWVMPDRAGATPLYGQEEFAEDARRNQWLVLATGEAGISAPIELRQSATLRVARLEDTTLAYAMRPERFGYLFVAEGTVSANGETLNAGDAVRMHSITDLTVSGSGELVFWDVPAI
jgi:redox-sensitive bicupin YhaK (pirin superfamily)